MSPEALNDQIYGVQADIWSLGKKLLISFAAILLKFPYF